jgi:glycerol-3-phosphate dehydrogenase
VQPAHLLGSVQYWDGQFNGTKLALALARTAAMQGALMLNHMKASQLIYVDGKVSDLNCEDVLTVQGHAIQVRCVVNATGGWMRCASKMARPSPW